MVANPAVPLATRPVSVATRRPEVRLTRAAVASPKVAGPLALAVAVNLVAAAQPGLAVAASLAAAAMKRLEARLARAAEARPAAVGRLAPALAVSPDRVGLLQGQPVSLEPAGAAEGQQVQPGLRPPVSVVAAAGLRVWEEPEVALT